MSITKRAPVRTRRPADQSASEKVAPVAATRPLLAMLISDDGAPASENAVDGRVASASSKSDLYSLELEMACATEERLMVGVLNQHGDYDFAVFEVEEQLRIPEDTTLELLVSFAKDDRDLLREENLLPYFDRDTQRYDTWLPIEILNEWAYFEVLRPRLYDRVYCCPNCEGVTNFRQGCRACGSARTIQNRMIHHFACAHVGPVAEFQQPGGIACPKCLMRDLVVGADFEFFNGVNECEDCEWRDTEMTMVGVCMACQLRLPIELANQKDLIAYDVDRLDPLAFVDVS